MADSGTDLEARSCLCLFYELIDEHQIQGFYDGYLMRLKEVLQAKGQMTRF